MKKKTLNIKLFVFDFIYDPTWTQKVLNKNTRSYKKVTISKYLTCSRLFFNLSLDKSIEQTHWFEPFLQAEVVQWAIQSRWDIKGIVRSFLQSGRTEFIRAKDETTFCCFSQL